MDLPGGRYRFEGLSEAQLGNIAGRYGTLERARGSLDEPEVTGAERSAEVVCRVFRAPASHFLDFDHRGWEVTFDLGHDANAVRIAGDRYMARLDLDPRGMHASLFTDDAGRPEFEGIFDNWLRVILAYRMLELGGVLIHSAAAAGSQGAFLFFGHSGAGKSTISRLNLEAGRPILGDDLNACLWSGNEVTVERIPFAGDFGKRTEDPGPRTLLRLLRLRNGSPPALSALRPAEALATLVACCPFVNADPLRGGRLLDNLERLVARVPCGELTFALEPSFWDLLAPDR
jgi:hypothetical protein